MAGRAMNKPFAWPLRLATALITASVTLVACSQPADEPPLAGARLGGPFTLTDHNGKRVSDTQFAGSYRIVYFGYTFCPDVCPTGLQKLSQGLRLFEKSDPERAAKVQPIFITVDPQRDTPPVMKQYVAAFHPRLVGLTGTPEEIEAVKKSFAVYSKAQKAEGASEYLVDHMSQAMLFGPDGAPIALLPQDESGEAVAAVLEQWVR
jgi:protein SCO1/2